jgi:hypothetical protein
MLNLTLAQLNATPVIKIIENQLIYNKDTIVTTRAYSTAW